MARSAVKSKDGVLRDIIRSTADYEAWAGACISIVKADLERKHQTMRLDPFSFFRGTFYRWCELWPRVCPELEAGPKVLCVGDLHVENFGVWRDTEGRLVWGVNDYDEASEASCAVDLARLLASVLLAQESANIRLSDEAAAEILLDGWMRGMTNDTQPFVLNGTHKWLRKLALAKLKDPRAFWKKLNQAGAPDAAEAGVGGPKATAALPPGVVEVKLIHRVAGMGSLGHQRVVALGDWLGGEVAREAKALTPSAWLWAQGATAKGAPFRYEDILRQKVHCPDPTLASADGWLTRRLAPDGSRVELSDLPNKRDDEKMFHAMGRETANVVHRAPAAHEAIAFMKSISPKALLGAARNMTDALHADFERFKAG